MAMFSNEDIHQQFQDFFNRLPEPKNLRSTWTGTMLLEVRPDVTDSVIAKLKFELEKSGAQDFTFPGYTIPMCGTDYTPLELHNREDLRNVTLLLKTHFPDFKTVVMAPGSSFSPNDQATN
ncbi:uncharacterized protein LOC144859290 [Branchiostoma floridae x Branchiostoma japonicum]